MPRIIVYILRVPDKEHIFISIMPISSTNPMFQHLLESSHQYDSNKWSNIGFGGKIRQVVPIKVNFTLLIRSTVYFGSRDLNGWHILPVCMPINFFVFLSKTAIVLFSSEIILINKKSYDLSVKQFGSQMRPHVLWGLIWIQAVCKGL